MSSNISNIVADRIFSLVDEESFIELDPFIKCEVVIGLGYVNERPVYIFVQDPEKSGGAVSKQHCDKILKVYNLALKTGLPLVGMYDSVGARLNESPELFKLYGEVLKKASKLSGVVPQVSIVLGPCIGMMSVISMSADFVVMSKNAQMGINTNGDLFSNKDAEKSGLISINADSESSAISEVRSLISCIPSNNLDVMQFSKIDERKSGNTGNAVLDRTLDPGKFIEIQKNFGKSFDVGIAQIGGVTVGIVASRNQNADKVIDADSCLKVTRIVKFCDSFSIPVLTFIDAVRFKSLKEATALSNVYSEATTIKISVVTGEAYGAVCLAFVGESQDFSVALDCATISILPPNTAATILHSESLKESSNPIEDRKKLFEDYKNKEASAMLAAQNGLVSDVTDIKNLRDKLFAILEVMSSKRVETLPKKHSNV